MTIDVKGLNILLGEAQDLADRPKLSPAEERKYNFLLAGIKAIQNGATLRQVQTERVNATARANGLPELRMYDHEEQQRALASWIKTGHISGNHTDTLGYENRAELIGSGPFTSLNGNLGSFAPTQFFSDIRRSMAQHSPLFDEANVTLREVEGSASVEAISYFSDINNVAVPTSENVVETSADFNEVSADLMQTTSFRSPRVTFSYETETYVPNWLSICSDILGDRIARGVGAYLLNGSGANGSILGLMTATVALGATVTAIGSSETTGGSQNGTDSIGVTDLSNVFFSINAPYRQSPKFAWLMNSSTMKSLSTLLDKYGRPILDLQAPRLTIFGKKVLIDEGMPSIGSAQTPVLAGDLSYYYVKIVRNSWSLRRYTQAQNLVTQGAAAIRAFVRCGGVLMSGDSSNPSVYALVNNS